MKKSKQTLFAQNKPGIRCTWLGMMAVFAICLVSFTPLSAQALFKSGDALGMRLGGGYMFDTEINYQTDIGEENRLEIGFMWREHSGYYYNTSYYGLLVAYQWKWKIEDDGFSWYVGPAAGVGYWNYNWSSRNNGIFFDAGGQVGIEYDFSVTKNVPLTISLDVRPMLGLSGYTGLGWGAGLGVRCKF